MILAILIIVVFLLLDRFIEHDKMRKALEQLSAIDMKLIVMQMHLDNVEMAKMAEDKSNMDQKV